MKKIGRNDPCPCGSGKKYKHCRLGKEKQEDTRNLAQQVREEIEDKMSDSLRLHVSPRL